jgi:hypothetical protein
MPEEAPVQFTQVPPKPVCNPNNIFTGTDCQDRINLYNQAVAKRQNEGLQFYVNRQKDIASQQAIAPLRQQITELNNKILSDSGTAAQEKFAAYNSGVNHGLGIGVGVSLALYGIVFAIRRFGRFGQPRANAASA